MQKSGEPVVYISDRESFCGECHENLGNHAWITLDRDKGAVCLACADLAHLEFLPPGDRALTVRAKKYSGLYAVVLKWSRRRKRYERQGLLVEEEAIEKAETECLKDADVRERRRIREAERREDADKEYIRTYSKAVTLAVAAHIRHTMTNYDELLTKGAQRSLARQAVHNHVQEIMERWRGV